MTKILTQRNFFVWIMQFITFPNKTKRLLFYLSRRSDLSSFYKGKNRNYYYEKRNYLHEKGNYYNKKNNY